MGRRAEGWKVRFKRGWAYCCFTHASVEHRIALGTRDPGEAARLAPSEYAAVVSGRRAARAARPSTLLGLDELMAEHIASLEGSLDEETRKTRVIYARKFFAHFRSLDRVTEASIGDYQRARLRQVLKKTVSKERSALADFLRWCVEQGALAAVPTFPELPRKATGMRAGTQREAPVLITAEQAHAIIAALPIESKKIGGRRWPVRVRFAVAWETGLRPETLACLSVPEHYRRGDAELRIDAPSDKIRWGRAVPLTEEARRQLDAVAPESGLIFGRHSFAKVLKRAAAAVLGEEQARTFAQYDFRHGRTTELVTSSGDLAGTGYLVGHKQATTTNRYTHGTRRAAERVLAVVSGTFTDPKASRAEEQSPAQPKNLGDRRGSNPRQLEPQRSGIAKTLLKTAGERGQRGSKSDPKSTPIRTGSGNPVRAAAGGLAVQLATWDALEAFASDAEDES